MFLDCWLGTSIMSIIINMLLKSNHCIIHIIIIIIF